MKIIIGSTNPVKIAAAQAIFSRISTQAQVTGLSVESGVAAQPWGDEETQTGAVNRAKAALNAGADLGVGFEGGVVDSAYGLMTCAWCAVVNKEGTLGLGGGVNVLLPPPVAEALRAGGELGPVMDSLIHQHNTKQGPGAVGILTGGLSSRQEAYEHMLMLALAPFQRKDLYNIPQQQI